MPVPVHGHDFLYQAMVMISCTRPRSSFQMSFCVQSEECPDVHHLLSIVSIKTPIHRSVSVTSLTPPHLYACPNQDQDFQRHLSCSFCYIFFSQLWLEMIVRFVNIGGIVLYITTVLYIIILSTIYTCFTVLPETLFT